MNSKFENNVLTLSLEGRIDSSNAANVEAEVFEVINANPATSITLDVDKLDYISSAGLRVVLKIKKANANTEIINVHPEVYEIFEMTGFTEMMEIHKAYRQLSVDGCEVIGRGANGEVYRLDPDTIIKLYLNPDSLFEIHRERELARKAFVLGIPTAIPYDVVKVGDKYGSVFELLSAKSFAQLINSGDVPFEEVMKMYVELLQKIHSTPVKELDMPNMKDEVVEWVENLKGALPDDVHAKLARMVDEIPVEMHMLHGDYHVKNVMLQNGEALLIDMDTLCYGNSIFEWGFIFNAYVGYGYEDPASTHVFLGIPDGYEFKVWEGLLKGYFVGKSEEELKDIAAKAEVVGLIRIYRRNIRKDFPTKDMYKQKLIDAINRVDNLIIK